MPVCSDDSAVYSNLNEELVHVRKGTVSWVSLEVTGEDASPHSAISPWRLRKLCTHFFPFFKTEMEITAQHVLAGKIKTVLTKFLTYKQS